MKGITVKPRAAILFPGQGTQKPGMLNPWATRAKEQLESWSEAIDLDLLYYGCYASAQEILPTRIVQPLLCAAGLLAWQDTQAEFGKNYIFSTVAGHSAGQIAAAAVAGFLSAPDALRLAAWRGLAMENAAAKSPGSMMILLSTKPLDLATVSTWASASNVEIANVNNQRHYVLAGSPLAIANLEPPAHTRLHQLPVSGAFHSFHMAEAVPDLEKALNQLSLKDPTSIDFLSNVNGQPVKSVADFRTELLFQLINPVRWDIVIEQLNGIELAQVFEMAPGRALLPVLQRAGCKIPGQTVPALK